MSVQPTSSASGTDWDRLKRLPDEEILADDVPYDPDDAEAVAAFWTGARVSMPADREAVVEAPPAVPEGDPLDAVIVTLRLSPQVARYFRSTGRGWQARIDTALQEWIRGR